MRAECFRLVQGLGIGMGCLLVGLMALPQIRLSPAFHISLAALDSFSPGEAIGAENRRGEHRVVRAFCVTKCRAAGTKCGYFPAGNLEMCHFRWTADGRPYRYNHQKLCHCEGEKYAVSTWLWAILDFCAEIVYTVGTVACTSVPRGQTKRRAHADAFAQRRQKHMETYRYEKSEA